MTNIARDRYLQALVSRMWNGQVKVVTGIRRCGKSYLLKTIFRDWLKREKGVSDDDMLVIELDSVAWIRCRNPLELAKEVEEWRTSFLCSSIGSLTTPNNIANCLKATYGYDVTRPTVLSYMGHLMDAFLFSEARRYDVKGRSYFDYPNKYYCEDVGLRNARTGFRQQEVTHLMENVIYNELVARGFSVDVGVVISREANANGNSVRIPREIDFVVNKGGERVYVQSAFAIPMEDDAKRISEFKPFSLTRDSFRKIVVRQDVGVRWFDDQGILNVNLADFLLDPMVV